MAVTCRVGTWKCIAKSTSSYACSFDGMEWELLFATTKTFHRNAVSLDDQLFNVVESERPALIRTFAHKPPCLGDGKLEVSVELPKSPRGRLPSRDPVRHATTRRAVPSVARIEPCFGRQELWLPPVARSRLRLYTLAALQTRYGFTGTYIAVLGGAYSALGKYKEKYARKAGELALQQIKLAQLMRDPVQESKCWLYYAEDCIGVGMLKTAVRIIRKQRTFAKKTHDETLIKMCESTRGKLEAARDRLRNGKMVGQGCDDIESVDNRSIGTICLV
ncbi:hypothetical protein BC936DRAFT_138691 [Jimgerdemannia flammicorona]|uniref:Uncharacterized protein n=1 Tax=Jimgerdemannia flammicorona TaxID=994334 RepID=A0A433DIC1_9FUNG|nr:hypothetical protein BC936DRAFT_138691 [Jimgerdemannia flammicorona]